MIGETLGNYRVLSAIGKGGMGEVFLAEHTLIGRRVAIKVLLRQLSLDADSVTRFFNEARAAAKLHHPGLVEVFDFGHHSDGSAYIVMELLTGESLKARIERDTRFAPATALAIARQVAIALEAAHEQGIIHRDLKPENIFLLEDPDAPGGVRAKVLDFGIAKLVEDEVPNSVKTKTGAVFGTPRYMAPEQCKNAGGVDRRSDIYALGCILFEMLLGRPPFQYDNWGELVAAHIHLEPPRPREIDPELPAAIELVVMRMLAKQPQDRYATMTEVSVAIEDVWRNTDRRDALFTPPKGLTTIRPPGSAERTPLVGVAPTLPVAAEVSAPRVVARRRAPWIAGVVVIGAAAFTWVLLRGGDDARPAAPPPVPATSEQRPAAVVTVADAAPPHEQAPNAGPSNIELVVESVPPGADVYRRSDGVKLGKTPFTRTFERIDGGEIELLLKHSGYQDRRVTLSTAHDGKEIARLSPARTTHVQQPAKSGSNGPTMLDPYGENK
jgi:serine/threonine-protein kinase